jgi:pimeloyl-ACP methyl ester carboxylesterase
MHAYGRHCDSPDISDFTDLLDLPNLAINPPTLMSVSFLPVEQGVLAYRRFGRGSRTLVAFHGFGQDSSVFLPLETAIGSTYTVLAIDLFFHGQSQWPADWPADRLLTKTDWTTMLTALLKQEQVGRLSVIGFSLGGRFALTTVETLAHRTDELMLLAPDGVTVSFWYWLATRSMAGQWLFRRSLANLTILSRFGNRLTALGLLNRTRLRFAEGALANPAQREQVYLSWLKFRRLQPDLPQMSSLITAHAIDVNVFTGVYDRIVPPSYVEPLTRRLKQFRLTSFPVSHAGLIGQVANWLGDRLTTKTPGENR